MELGIAATVKQHPMAVGAAALGGLALLYILMSSGGGGQSSNAAALQSIAAANAQQQQLAAQVGAQNAQLSAQSYSQQLSAQVQNSQTQAAAQAQNYQTSAALIAALAGNQTSAAQINAQLSAYGIEAGVANNQTNAALMAAENTNSTNLQAYNAQVAYANNLAAIQGQLTSQGITAQTQLASQANQNAFNINNQIVGMVGQAGLNHGTASLEQQLTAILSGVMNQPAIGVATENTAAIQAQANAAQTASIWNAISNIGSAAVSGGMSALFGSKTPTTPTYTYPTSNAVYV